MSNEAYKKEMERAQRESETLAEKDIGMLTGWHSDAPIRVD